MMLSESEIKIALVEIDKQINKLENGKKENPKKLKKLIKMQDELFKKLEELNKELGDKKCKSIM